MPEASFFDLQQLSPEALVIIIAGLFYLVKELLGVLKNRSEVKQLKANGAGGAKTSDVATVLLEDSRDHLRDISAKLATTAANEEHVRQAVAIMQKTCDTASQAVESATQARDYAKEVRDASLGPHALDEDGLPKWMNKPSVDRATMETRDSLKELLKKMDALISAVQSHGCPYLDRPPERPGQ